MRVADLMETKVVTVEPDETIGRAREIMRHENIRHLVVRHEGVILGVVSDRDITGVDVAGQSEEARDFVASAPLRDVMTEAIVTITPEETVQKAANLMRGNKIGCLVVVADKKKKKLKGIITDTDLLEALSRMGSRTSSNQRASVRSEGGGRRR